MTHVTCRLTAKNWDRLRNRTLGNRLRATFNRFLLGYEKCGYLEKDRAAASRSVPVDTIAWSDSAGRETVSERERESVGARDLVSRRLSTVRPRPPNSQCELVTTDGETRRRCAGCCCRCCRRRLRDCSTPSPVFPPWPFAARTIQYNAAEPVITPPPTAERRVLR